MGKRVAIIAVVLLVIVLAILGYHIQQGRNRMLTDPYKSVTPEACIVIETKDLQNFINTVATGKGICSEVARVKEFQKFTKKLRFFAGQLNEPGYKELLEGSTSIIALYPGKNGKLTGQLSLNVPGDLRIRRLKEILRSSGISAVDEGKIDGLSIIGQ